MKEKLLGIIREKPGLRIREIAGYVGCGNFEVSKLLHELKREGVVYSVYHRDFANMDCYDMWFVKEG